MSGAVCLSFHFDAISLWTGTFNMTSPSPASRGEFSARVAVPRILKILEREEVTATFFIPGKTVETWPALCREILAKGHEIAHHGYEHVSPMGLTKDEERAHIQKGLDAMATHLDGYRPVGYCSPVSDLGSYTLELLIELGFVYDATMSAQDFEPYRVRLGDVVEPDATVTFGQESSLIEVPFSWSLDDFPQMEFVWGQLEGLADPRKAESMWLDDMDFMFEEVPNGVYPMCFHPEVIGRAARVRVLERMIARGKSHGGSFKSFREAAEDWAAANPRA